MKMNIRSGITIMPLILVAIMAVAFRSPSTHIAGTVNPSSSSVKSDSLPADIKAFIQTSCTSCHADGGKALAMSKLNFSEWNNYDSGKKAKKAEAMANILEKGSMPPKSFIKSHPEAVPTKDQIEMVGKWAKELAKE